MHEGGASLAVLGSVLLVGLLGPMLLRRLHLPMVSSVILVGAAIGPHGLDWVRPDATLTSFGFLGAAFSLVLLGIQTHGLSLRLHSPRAWLLLACSGPLPAAITAGLVLAFGYDGKQAGFVGAAFLSSSILVVFAMVEHHDLDETELGHTLKSMAVVLDMLGALLAFVLLKLVQPHGRFPLWILLGLLLVSVVVLRMYLPEITDAVFRRLEGSSRDAEEQKVTFSLALLLLILFAYSTLDVPAFLSAFLVGYTLATVRGAEELGSRLRLVGQAMFIPVFLFAVGLETDLGALIRLDSTNLMVATLVVSAVLVKGAGAYLGSMGLGLSQHARLYLAVASTPRLSVSLTSGYAGYQTGLLDAPLLTAVALTSVLTTVLGPLLLELIRSPSSERST